MIYLELRHTIEFQTYAHFKGSIARRRIQAGIYYADAFNDLPFSLAGAAERIWTEDDKGVSYTKCRTGAADDSDPFNVNLKEFAWIKLQAKSL